MHPSTRKDRKYSIVPYQESWRDDFLHIAGQIKEIFGQTAREILHVGSTSIVGMSGKPTIDVLVIVDDIKFVDVLNTNMERAGYVPLGEYVAPGGRLFAKEVNHERLANIHCFTREHPHAQEMIVMRDFFNVHPDEMREYAELKTELYKRYPTDYEAYRGVKDPYLARLKERAMEWLKKGES